MSKFILNDGYKQIIDENLKDAFNKKIYVCTIEGNFSGLRYLISKKEQEKTRKKHYANYQKMNMLTSAECIDITKETFKKILKLGYRVPDHYINNKWNALYEV